MFRRQAGHIISAIVFLCFIAPAFAHAVTLPTIVPQDNGCNGPGGCQNICALAELADNLLNDGIYVAVFLSAILFAWAGWKYVTAGGESGKISEAKKIFMSVTGGLVLILAAWLIVNVIYTTLTGNSNWNQLCNQPSATSELFVG